MEVWVQRHAPKSHVELRHFDDLDHALPTEAGHIQQGGNYDYSFMDQDRNQSEKTQRKLAHYTGGG